jgi:hypothetical protein
VERAGRTWQVEVRVVRAHVVPDEAPSRVGHPEAVVPGLLRDNGVEIVDDLGADEELNRARTRDLLRSAAGFLRGGPLGHRPAE